MTFRTFRKAETLQWERKRKREESLPVFVGMAKRYDNAAKPLLVLLLSSKLEKLRFSVA